MIHGIGTHQAVPFITRLRCRPGRAIAGLKMGIKVVLTDEARAMPAAQHIETEYQAFLKQCALEDRPGMRDVFYAGFISGHVAAAFSAATGWDALQQKNEQILQFAEKWMEGAIRG